MATMQDLKRRARPVIGPVLGCLFVGYFVYHSIQGDHGVLAWRQLDLRVTEAESTLAALIGERDSLNHRVSMLRPESLDPDMLEEQGRRLLNFSHPDDIFIISAAAVSGGSGSNR
jgi:cell division protein FtsB